VELNCSICAYDNKFIKGLLQRNVLNGNCINQEIRTVEYQRNGVVYWKCCVTVSRVVYQPVTVKIAVSISPHHHAVMIGQGGLTLQQMMQRTGATIQFPNLSITDSQQRGTVYISGTMAGVCAARHLLLVCNSFVPT